MNQPQSPSTQPTVPGVGVITATAWVALVADIRRFPSGRHFASFLGLTPKEDSTGEVTEGTECRHDDNADAEAGQVLLVLDTLIDGQEHVELRVGECEQGPVPV